MSISTASFVTNSTNDSSMAYALAGNDSSYKYYNNITWSCWVCMLPGLNKNIWGLWESATSDNRSWLFSVQSSGTIRLIFSATGTGLDALYTTVPAVLTNSWANIVVTFASGSFFVYVNDVPVSISAVIPWGAGAVPLFSANTEVMFGSIDPTLPPIDNSPAGNYSNFSMWNKVLNATERTELYNNGRPADLTLHSASANLTNWWRFDQSDTPPTITDQIAPGASATITQTGPSGIFLPSANFATVEDYPAEAVVLNGVVYNDGEQTGTLVIPTAGDIWNAPIASYTTSGTFGWLMQQLLTLGQFLGLK